MKTALLIVLAFASLAQQPTQPKKPAPKKPPESFIQWLARVTGISATSSGLKGIDIAFSGDIWLLHIDKPGGQRLTFEGSYSWPVFSKDDQAVIAIRDGALWSVPLSGADPAKLPHSLPGVAALIGTGPDGIVAFTAQEVGLFKPESGEFLPFKAATKDDRDAIARMQSPIRDYGSVTVSEKGKGILIEANGKTQEIEADGERQGEPSLSHDHKRMVYIRVKIP